MVFDFYLIEKINPFHCDANFNSWILTLMYLCHLPFYPDGVAVVVLGLGLTLF